MSALRNKQLIGWREWIVFPDWSDSPIRAKTDTGARSSAVDVASIEVIGTDEVLFDLIVDNKDRSRHQRFRCPIKRRSRVKSSNGTSVNRIFVETRLRLGTIEKVVEIGLVCRKNMLCRALIGRSSLGSDFIIDPAKKYLADKPVKMVTSKRHSPLP